MAVAENARKSSNSRTMWGCAGFGVYIIWVICWGRGDKVSVAVKACCDAEVVVIVDVSMV